MNAEEKQQYAVATDGFWSVSYFYDGYEMMEIAERKGWNALAGWGKEGYDLGSWPYVIIFTRNGLTYEGIPLYQVATYCEGDVYQYAFPSEELAHAYIDDQAFYYWKRACAEWVKDYDSVDQLPEELRGPYRR